MVKQKCSYDNTDYNRDRIVIFFLLIIYNVAFGQKDRIQLPLSSNTKVNYSKKHITQFFSIYVTKEKEVYLEDINVPISHLSDSIIKYRDKINLSEQPFLQLHLLADKELKYKCIQEVKSEISKSKNFIIVYRTGNINDIESGLIRRMNRQNFEVRDVDKEKLEAQFNEEYKIVIHPIYKMIDQLYYLNFSEAQKIMKNYNYKHIRFEANNVINLNGEKHNINNLDKIHHQLKTLDFVFITINPKLFYDDYVHNLQAITEYFKAYKIRTGLIEITNELYKKMRKKKIRLFNTDS